MALTFSVGETDTLTAVADDVSGAVDPNAVLTFASDDAGAFITLVDNGGGSATVTALAVGTANVTATATDPDGSTAHSDPFAVTVTAPVVSTDATTVTITAGTAATGGSTIPVPITQTVPPVA